MVERRRVILLLYGNNAPEHYGRSDGVAYAVDDGVLIGSHAWGKRSGRRSTVDSMSRGYNGFGDVRQYSTEPWLMMEDVPLVETILLEHPQLYPGEDVFRASELSYYESEDWQEVLGYLLYQETQAKKEKERWMYVA